MSIFQTYTCDDGALYYIRQINNDVFWFAEHKQRGFSSIFHGKRDANQVSGEVIACCKGNRNARGTLSFTLSNHDLTLTLDQSSAHLTGNQWTACVQPLAGIAPCLSQRATSVPIRAGFQGEGKDNLTGTWRGNDGLFYYVTEFGQRIVWMGEKPGACHIFIGERLITTVDDQTQIHIKGRRVDLPKADQRNDETVQYLLRDHPRIGSGVLDREAGHLSLKLARYEQLDVEVKLDTLSINATDERRDEPFLWTAFIKLDGDTINVSDARDQNDLVFGAELLTALRASSPQVSSTSGSHHNLGGPDRVEAGTTVSIPAPTGRFATTLRTITGLDPAFEINLPNIDEPTNARELTGMGMVVVAWEQDGFKDETIEAGRAALTKTLRDELDDQIANGELQDFSALEGKVAVAVEKAIRDNAGLVLNPDDLLGFFSRRFTFAELAQAQGRIAIDHTFTGDDKHPVAYRLRGGVNDN